MATAPSIKRRICSQDMALVPDSAFVLCDPEGEMYFCNARCLALWSMQHLTHPHVKPETLNVDWVLTTPEGAKRRFSGLSDVAKWAAANLLSPGVGEWAVLGAVEDRGK